MNVSDLHPEDLLDREAEGELSPNERAMLDAHLAHCVACRLEREVRADFAAELAEDSPEPLRAASDMGGGGTLVMRALESQVELAAPPVLLRRSRFQRRFGAAVIAAAVLMLGTAAVAGGGSRVWAAIFTPAPEEAVTPPLAPVAPLAPKKKSVGRRPNGTQAQNQAGAQGVDDVDPQGVDVEEAPPVPVLAPPTACAPVPPPPAPVTSPVSLAASARGSSHSFASLSDDNAGAGSANAMLASASSANAMFASANNARRHGDHAAAIRLYRDLLDKHVSAPESGPARLALGRLLLDDGNASSALPLFDRYLDDGGGELREEAMVGRARAFEKLGRVSEERAAWKTLLASYPQSVHTAHAEARLEDLRSR